LTAEAEGLFLDYSKNRVTDETMRLLVELAEQSGLRERIDAMFSGEHINITEDRAVLHVALRAPADVSIVVDGTDVVPEVHAVLDRMARFSDAIRSGKWTGHTRRRIRNVVNIGIGGSDLGPVMAYEALAPYRHESIECRFISNLDPTDAATKLAGLDPATTSSRRSTRCSTGSTRSPRRCAPARGPGSPASGSGPWSTSASAARTWGR